MTALSLLTVLQSRLTGTVTITGTGTVTVPGTVMMTVTVHDEHHEQGRLWQYNDVGPVTISAVMNCVLGL